jgi:hypothetical protein
VFAGNHQTRALKLSQSFAHGHPRNLKTAGHIGLADAVAGLDVPIEDVFQQVLANQLGQRSVSHRFEAIRGVGGDPRQHGVG